MPRFPFAALLWLMVSALGLSCARNSAQENSTQRPQRDLPASFGDYWYQGEGELSSFRLKQARYGQVHTGTAVLVYVTEPFYRKRQVKANQPGPNSVNVLKLNRYKHFTTGIYPYSMMTSSFVPVHTEEHALKVTTSVQEWCGQVYMQLNRREGRYQTQLRSYFQSEGDTTMEQKIVWLEDELWNLIRLQPQALPEGELEAVPSFFFLRLRHKPSRTYTAKAEKSTQNGETTYTLRYPQLERRLQIRFESSFPHRILGWRESYPGGSDQEDDILSTEATRIQTLQTDYWTKNQLQDSTWRQKLGLRPMP
jgi:hypothetical protein